MTPELLEPGLGALDALAGYDSVCVLITEDERPLEGATGFLDWRLCGALSRVLKNGFFTGTPGEKLLVPTDGRVSAQRVFAVGLGKRTAVTQLGFEHALTTATTMLAKAKVGSVALAVPTVTQLDDSMIATLLKRSFLTDAAPKKVAIFADKTLRAQLATR